ncbi:Something about silencing protein 10 [Diplonema papillatum]|nr:Something about silencing protein 10 [Diplonema papillatum]
MPGKKRKGTGGGNRRKKPSAPEMDLEDIDSDEFEVEDVGFDKLSDDDQQVMFNRSAAVEEKGLDARYEAHEEEGRGVDAGLGDLDAEQQELALEEQQRRMQQLDEADFGVEELGLSAGKKPDGKKKPKKTATQELDALSTFLKTAEASLPTERVALDHAALTPEERKRLLSKTAPELEAMLADFREKLSHVRDVLVPVLDLVKAGELPTSDGVGFLEMKMHVFLTYLMHLTFYFILKAEGKPVADSPVVEKLVELRAYMDKLKPIEKKLQHQISRLLSRAAVKAAGGKAQKSDRANAAALAEVKESAAGDMYVAPKGVSSLSADEKKARQDRLLDAAQQKRAAMEEGMMGRVATSRKADKVLKNARELMAADTAGDEDAGMSMGRLGGSLALKLKAARARQVIEMEAEDADGESMEEDEEASESDGSGEEGMEGEEGEEDVAVDDRDDAEVKKFYADEVARLTRDKKQKKRESNAARQHTGKKPENLGEAEGEVIDGHRKISSQIGNNRGLVPLRNKKFKNPRVRSKIRAKKLETKVRQQQPTRKLRADIVRSRPMS